MPIARLGATVALLVEKKHILLISELLIILLRTIRVDYMYVEDILRRHIGTPHKLRCGAGNYNSPGGGGGISSPPPGFSATGIFIFRGTSLKVFNRSH